MNIVAPCVSDATPENRYRKVTQPQERHCLRGQVVERYRPKVAALVRSLLRTAQHWEDAEHAGIVGLLVALDCYRPELVGKAGFWGFARLRVRDEIRAWMDVGVYWRKQTNRGKSSRRIANREAAKASSLHWSWEEGLVESQRRAVESQQSPPTPEDLLSEAQEAARLEAFVKTLSEDQKALLLTDDRRKTDSRHHKTLMSQARAALRVMTAKEGNQ